MFSTAVCENFSSRSASPRNARSKRRCAMRSKLAGSRAMKNCRPRWFSRLAASVSPTRSPTKLNSGRSRCSAILLSLSPCGRGWLASSDARRVRGCGLSRTPHPTRTSSAPPSPTGGEGKESALQTFSLKGQHHMDIKVRDSNGALLAEGDSVTLIKDLKLKGSSTVLKRGTVIKNIHLTDNEDEIEGRTDKVKGLVLRTEFLKKA